MSVHVIRLMFLCIAIVLVGCAKDRGYVQREWSTTMRELGIVPVFPPREDVFVGDIYAYEFDPDSLKTDKLLRKKWHEIWNDNDRRQRMSMGMSPRAYRLDLNAAAEDEYRRTLAAPATPDDYNSILGNQALAKAVQNVTKAEAALKKVQALLKTRHSALKTADQALVQAQRNKEQAERDLKVAQAKLKEVSEATSDVNAEQGKVDNARELVRENEKLVRDETRTEQEKAAILSRLPENDPNRLQAQYNLDDAEVAKREAEFNLKEAQAKFKIAEDELAKARDNQEAISGARKEVIKKAGDLRTQETELAQATYAKADAEKALADEVKATEGKITAKTKDVEDAKSVRDAIAKAGERVLYAQPRDAKRSVYTAAALTIPNDTDDLLNARTNRLRLVGFPEFATASFTKGDLSALIPIEAFSLGLNASSAKVSSVTVKIPAAESYGVPISALIGKDVTREAIDDAQEEVGNAQAQYEEVLTTIEELKAAISEVALALAEELDEETRSGLEFELDRHRGDLDTAQTDLERMCEVLITAQTTLNAMLSADRLVSISANKNYELNTKVHEAIRFQFADTQAQRRSNGFIYLRVPTEVFYARALDVSVFYANSYGVRSQLALIQETQGTPAPTADAADGSPTQASAVRSSASTGAQLLQSVEASLGRTMTVPGGSVQLIGFNETSVGLRRVFDRPVAIGFRGITLKVDLKSGIVKSVNVGQGTVSTNR